MRKRYLAAGAAVLGAALVTVPVASALESDEARPARHAARPTAAPWHEPHLLESAYWAQVGEHVKTVQIVEFLRELERRIQAEAAAARRSSGGRGGSGGGGGSCLDSIRHRESRGDYGAVSPGGTYRGAYQFDQQTWDSNAAASGRTDLVGVDPAAADPAAQDQIAADTFARRGNQPWGGRC